MCIGQRICSIDSELKNIYGRVRIVPLDRNYGGNDVFAVGDAAGQACPNMVEGIPPAISNGNFLAEMLNRDPKYSGYKYYKDWRYGSHKAEPFEMSAAFVLERYPKYEAGSHAKIYKAIANSGNVSKMMRLISERRIRINDIPDLIQLGLKEPEILANAAMLLIKTRFAFTLPSYNKILYGESVV